MASTCPLAQITAGPRAVPHVVTAENSLYGFVTSDIRKSGSLAFITSGSLPASSSFPPPTTRALNHCSAYFPDWPLYCDEGSYCVTSEPYLECCRTASVVSYTSVYTITWTETERNSVTMTSVSSESVEGYSINYSNCSSRPACYNSTDASSCTGDCLSTAVVCTDRYFPYSPPSPCFHPEGFSTSVIRRRTTWPLETLD